MRAITVEAQTLDSARRLCDALSDFHPELRGDEDEGYRVSVELLNSDRDIVSVLGALERYVKDGGGLIVIGGERNIYAEGKKAEETGKKAPPAEITSRAAIKIHVK